MSSNVSSDERTAAVDTASPEPSSHATNIYDIEDAGGEFLDEEEDDDDMDLEPMADDSEDLDFFDTTDEAEAEFHGMRAGQWLWLDLKLSIRLTCNGFRCR